MLVMRIVLIAYAAAAAELKAEVGCLGDTCGASGDTRLAAQGQALLQRPVSVKAGAALGAAWDEQREEEFVERIDKPGIFRWTSPSSSAGGAGGEGSIEDLPCGVPLKLNVSFSLDARCPSACPLHVDTTSESEQDFCNSLCVGQEDCKRYNPKAPVADFRIGGCRAAVVDGCEVRSSDGTDTCVECGDFFYLTGDRKCARKYAWALYGLAAVLAVLVGAILLFVGDLLLRPVTNEEGLKDALDFRSKQKFWMPGAGRGRHLYPLSLNLCKNLVGGPGLALHFRFQAVLVVWAAVIAIGWILLACAVDYDLLVLGTKEFGTAFRNCILVAWGRATQRRLMWVKERFLLFVYLFSFLGSMVFAARQLRFWHKVDDDHDTMKDFTLRVFNLPSTEGTEHVEEELKECIQQASGQAVVGVSVCWDYQEQQEALHIQLQKDLDRRHRPGYRRSELHSAEQDMGPFRKTLFRLEHMILSQDGEQDLSEGELRAVIGSLRSCHTAFAVFETERARDEAAASLAEGFLFRGQHASAMPVLREPHGVNWKNMDTSGFAGKVQRLGRGFLFVVGGLLLYICVFYAPYAWSILQFNYQGGQQPGIVYTLAFSLVVCVGNLLMAEICCRVADTIGFEYKDTRENCYMILYLGAIVTNVGLDLWITYFMASQIMISLDFRTEDGRLLTEVDSFVERFQSYALQRSMGQQLYEYAFPCTFIVPFVAEPLAVIFLFSRTFMLLVRSHPELKTWEARGWLAAMDLELGRYADCLVNVYLAVLVFFFPGGYTHWIFALFALCHIYIYAYDHYKVLRVAPRVLFHSMFVDFCAQALLAPACGILLSCLVFKANCIEGSYCLEPRLLLLSCLAAFLAHCAIHLFLLWFVVPRLVHQTRPEKTYRKDAKTFREVAAQEPCSWFTANPIHCLRSKLVYRHSPPCSFYTPGLEHTMQVNESIGCYYFEPEGSVEEVESYLRMPTFRDLPTFGDLKQIIEGEEEEESGKGDTGASAS